MVVVTSAYGSEGDILPMLALARECRLAAPASTRVVFLSNPRFEPPEARLDRRPGSLEFVGVGSREAYDAMLADSRDARRRTRRALARFWVSHLEEHFRELRVLTDGVVDKTVVVVTHPLDLAARCFDEWAALSGKSSKITCVTAALSPAMLRCDDVRAPVLTALFGEYIGLALSRHAPRLAWRLYDAAVDHVMRGVDAFRRERVFSRVGEDGLAAGPSPRPIASFKPARGVYRDWFVCRGGVLAMWPPWFGAPHPQWPCPTTQVGFPGALARREGEKDENASLTPFLEDARDAGEDVWVFMVGSGNPPHARAFFKAAVRAASTARVRAVLLTRHADVVPGSVPDAAPAGKAARDTNARAPVLRAERCDLRALFSHGACAGVVHGGGVGTTAVALACGVAQIVVPSGFDQHDNARRARRLAAAGTCAEISVGAFCGKLTRVARTMARTAKNRRERLANDASFDATELASDAQSWGGARRAAAHVLASAFGRARDGVGNRGTRLVSRNAAPESTPRL